MSKLLEPVTSLSLEFKNYVNLRMAYVGLQLGNRLAVLVSSAITAMLLLFLLTMIVLMLSFAFVFWYAAKIGTYYHGFLIVSLVYGLIGLFVYANRKNLFIKPMMKRMHEQLLSEVEPDLLPGFEQIESSEQQMRVLKRRIALSEQALQQSAEAFAESLHPLSLIKKLLGNSFTSSAITVSLLEFAISWLRRRGDKKNQDASPPSSDG